MHSRIDELATLIRPYVATDELKFYSTAAFERALSEDPKVSGVPGGRTAIGLKAFVVERSESVRQQLEGVRKSSPGDGSGNGGSFGRTGGGDRRPARIPPGR